MGRLTSYTQAQLTSSVVGVPGVDRSSEIIAGALQGAANQFAGVQLNAAQKQRAAEDSLAVNAINESRDIASLDMQQFMQTNPDPSTWVEGWDNIISGQQAIFSQQQVTQSVARNEKVNQKAFEVKGRKVVQLAASEQTVQNNIDVSGKNLIKTMSNPFSSEDDRVRQQKLYNDALGLKFTKEVADVHMEEILLAAEEQAKETANSVARNLISSSGFDLDSFEGATTEEIRSVLPGSDSLSNANIESLRDYAATVGNEKDDKSKLLSDQKTVEGYGFIRDAAPGKPFDLDAFSDTVELDPDMTDEDKITTLDKVKSYYSTYNSAVSNKVDTPDDTRIVMNKLRQKIRRADIVTDGGFYNADMAFEDYKKMKSAKGFKVNTTDNRNFLENIFKDEDSARNVQMKKMQTVLDGREKRIRDAIETQPSLLGIEEIDEILRDFANIAVNDFTDKFIDDTPDTFDKDNVDAFATELIQKFTLSPTQRSLVEAAATLKQEGDFKQKQLDVKAAIESLIAEGNVEEAVQLGNEAEILGLIKQIDGNIVLSADSSKATDKNAAGAFGRIVKSMFGL